MDKPRSVALKDVLVVDDEPLVRDTLELSLHPEFRVVKAASGQEALDLAERQTFPVVVLDLRMEGLDGIATLKRLRRQNAFQKVVILTAHQSMESAIEAVNLGAHGYLTKPCDFGELRNLLSEAHERYFAEQERMEACRERMLRPHDDFFSVLCHEFNTPLNGIIGFASVLKDELEDDEKSRMAAFIEETAGDLHQVFLEILDYINSKVPGQQKDHATFSGSELAKWLGERRNSQGGDFLLEGHFWQSEERLDGPFHSLGAILSKSVMAGGCSGDKPARIVADRRRRQLVFTLQDLDLESRFGEPENPEVIFSPYATPTSTRRRFNTGIGLHLATCRNLADTVGIHLEARRAPGSGIQILVTAEVADPSVDPV